MEKSNYNDDYSPYLKVLRQDVCHKCLQTGALLPSKGRSLSVRAYCTNPKCELYKEEWTIPAGIFEFLFYLTEHQPDE